MRTHQKNLECRAWSEKDLSTIAQEILTKYSKNSIFLISGPLGVGKSTLVRAILEILIPSFDSRGSPTFPVMQEYRQGGSAEGAGTPGNSAPIYHIDLYRIRDEAELSDAGIDFLLWENPGLTFIEWPEIAPSLCADLRRSPPVVNGAVLGTVFGVVDVEISFGDGCRVVRCNSV